MSSYWAPPSLGGGHTLEPRSVLVGCVESGSRQVLLDQGALPPEFFDLSTRLAGDLLHQLGKYGIRLAAVVPDPTRHSQPFQDFVRECARREDVRFFATREAAVAWLETAADPG